MATALVGSPTSAGSSRAEQERQFSRDGGSSSSSGLQQQADAGPPAETLQATREMCAYCFDVIIAHFNNIEPPPPSFSTSYVCGMFVTWDRHEHGTESLRGCIGTLHPQAISQLRDYTYSRRFAPIEMSELASLDVSVSLLVKYEPAQHWEDWEIGVHGIVIKFNDDRGSSYSATFLPEVAAEQGWSRKVTLSRLVRKAGYKRVVDRAFLAGVEVTRYQSSKHKLPYQEYLEMRRLAQPC
ncbi:unnamed protein product [Ectocarpus sp. 8 AP-2014]